MQDKNIWKGKINSNLTFLSPFYQQGETIAKQHLLVEFNQQFYRF